jgi:sulfotransferase family protein
VPNPYLFVTGCTRSGTTLLQRMLDSHPQLAVSNDTHLIPRSVLELRGDPDLPLTHQLVREVTGYRYFRHLGVETETAERLARSCRTLAELVRALFDEMARRRGKPLAGEKDPEYVRRLPVLHRLFPSARIVHVVRDGRDVALSTLDWMTPSRFLGRMALWREEPVAVCALWWRRQVSAGRRGRAVVGQDRCLEVRYEQLVCSPESALASVARFLELPYEPQMLRYNESRSAAPVRARRPEVKDQWLPPIEGLRDWRTTLTQRDLQLFEALAGDLLTSLGYPRATNGDVAPGVQAVAERCERWWAANVEQPAGM